MFLVPFLWSLFYSLCLFLISPSDWLALCVTVVEKEHFVVLACSFQRNRVQWSPRPCNWQTEQKAFLALSFPKLQNMPRQDRGAPPTPNQCNIADAVSSCSTSQPERGLYLEFYTLKDCEEKSSRKCSACPHGALRTREWVPVHTAQDLGPERKFDLWGGRPKTHSPDLFQIQQKRSK